ncbi:Nucleotide-binding universal stress protein, UspA family [Persephonella hydrogeniphila]|uniref:Nucleotide-binding universal stress protein, UspA family n=1 Tax=Persephonella hydrogeniphila TaxID=198703 RepID=A0A285NB01_9AQUI|nr:universal stress protein [Persephonella hydrogeniphila]SNZ06645.1 Nucleotide-binding universal stress protein, UspA family [Persephonella hydrogeniphila]
MEIKKIVVCVDLTPLSLKALEWAKSLSEKYGAELVVFHEMEDVYTMINTSASFGMPASPDLKEQAEKNVVDKLTPLLKDIEGKYRLLIEAKGKTVDRLVDVVREENPDLTVITIDYERDVPKLDSQILVIK